MINHILGQFKNNYKSAMFAAA